MELGLKGKTALVAGGLPRRWRASQCRPVAPTSLSGGGVGPDPRSLIPLTLVLSPFPSGLLFLTDNTLSRIMI